MIHRNQLIRTIHSQIPQIFNTAKTNHIHIHIHRYICWCVKMNSVSLSSLMVMLHYLRCLAGCLSGLSPGLDTWSGIWNTRTMWYHQHQQTPASPEQWARIVRQALRRSDTKSLLCQLHWLLVKQRISYKLAVMTFKVRITSMLSYLSRHHNEQTLRSSSTTVFMESFTSQPSSSVLSTAQLQQSGTLSRYLTRLKTFVSSRLWLAATGMLPAPLKLQPLQKSDYCKWLFWDIIITSQCPF